MLLVNGRNQVGPVIHGELWFGRQNLFQMTEKLLLALPFYRKGRDVVIGNEARGDIVLRRERIGGAEKYIRATRLERPYQIGSFGGDVETGRERFSLEWPLLFKTLAHLSEDRHIALGPLDAP